MSSPESQLTANAVAEGNSAFLALLAKADLTSAVQDCVELLNLHLTAYRNAELSGDLTKYQAQRPHPATDDMEKWSTDISGKIIDCLSLNVAPFIRAQIITVTALTLSSAISHYSTPVVIWSTILQAATKSDAALLDLNGFRLSGRTWAKVQTVGGITKLLISPPSNDKNRAFLNYTRLQIFQGWWRKAIFNMSAPLHVRFCYIINAILCENEDSIKALLLNSSKFVQLHETACTAPTRSSQKLRESSEARAGATHDAMIKARSVIPTVLGQKVVDVATFSCKADNISLLGSIVDRIVAAVVPQG